MANPWMTAEQAAAHLGVKAETLYAYVSRGLLDSERDPGERRSRYRRSDVERLAARRRAGGRAGALDIIVESDLTLLDPAGALFYRGWDVEDAVRHATFEEVASWLWTGERDGVPFEAPEASLALARRIVDTGGEVPAIDRLRMIVPAIRPADPLRADRRPIALAATGRALIATLVEALPVVTGAVAESSPGLIAARLWPRLSPVPAGEAQVRLLDAVLVLLADHELAASTLAARVTASTWADPYLVVQAGMAAVGGPLHGGSSSDARELIREVASGDRTPAEAVGSRLDEGRLIPGFGHRVYDHHDPRARVLFDRLEALGVDVPVAHEVIATMKSRELPFPNIDFALAAIEEAHQMIPGAGQVMFTIARIAGWLAHASEEYQYRLRFRPRAAYTGPRPAAIRRN